jgi:hypothetical protein
MSRFLFCLLLILSRPGFTHAHELPDGEIERRVQVTVKPDRVLLQYSLAMSKATLEKELRKHKQKPSGTFSGMWKQYQRVILPSLQKHLRVTVDGKCLPVKGLRADYTGWSHRHLTCLLKTDIQLTEDAMTIVVIDGNYPDEPGNYRIAMKARSGATMKTSNVSPLVMRAKPVVLAKLKKEQKKVATRAEGSFSVKQGT